MTKEEIEIRLKTIAEVQSLINNLQDAGLPHEPYEGDLSPETGYSRALYALESKLDDMSSNLELLKRV